MKEITTTRDNLTYFQDNNSALELDKFLIKLFLSVFRILPCNEGFSAYFLQLFPE